MKLKYMLRGLGIGLLVSAAAMGAYTRIAVADARVAVLKEYGLGDEPVLMGDYEESETFSADESIPIIIRDEPIESQIQSVIESAKEAETKQDTESKAETELEPTESEVSLNGDLLNADVLGEDDYIEITITQGDDSGSVSRRLYNAGIVDSASEYDAFLMQRGYDKRITPGMKTIYKSDTWQDIAEKLTH
jgi:hypothetical protein